jgi:hypothetical protein
MFSTFRDHPPESIAMMLLLRHSILAGVVAATLASSAAADDLSGADDLLCTPIRAEQCTASAGCQSSLPWELNMPLFVHVDLAEGVLATTEASGENRETRIQSVTREDGIIVLQGIDQQRAYSFMIIEETGLLSVAVARDGITVSVFGACTPKD